MIVRVISESKQRLKLKNFTSRTFPENPELNTTLGLLQIQVGEISNILTPS